MWPVRPAGSPASYTRVAWRNPRALGHVLSLKIQLPRPVSGTADVASWQSDSATKKPSEAWGFVNSRVDGHCWSELSWDASPVLREGQQTGLQMAGTVRGQRTPLSPVSERLSHGPCGAGSAGWLGAGCTAAGPAHIGTVLMKGSVPCPQGLLSEGLGQAVTPCL